MADSRLCRNGKKGDWDALNCDAIDLIAQHMDITGAVRLAACSRELCNLIGNNEGNVHHWDEPCMLMPLPAYWFNEHWDEARDIRLHDTVYDVVPLDNPRHTIVLPFMHDRMWVGMNGGWITAVDDSGDWCLANIYMERHIPLTLPPRLVPSRAPKGFCNRSSNRWHIDHYDYIYWFDGRPDENLILKKIVICEVPTKHWHYTDYKLIALFDQALAYLEGCNQEWRLLKKADISPWSGRRHYCDAIELGGLIFAVDDDSGTTYCWDAAHDGNFSFDMLHWFIHCD